MRQYELTVVLSGGTSSAKKKNAQNKVEEIVKTFKGKMGKVSDWGEKELAYKIKNNTSGVFLHFPLELEAGKARELDTKLKTEEDIIRYLLVRI